MALNGRVRDGIGCFAHAMTTKPGKIAGPRGCRGRYQEGRCHETRRRGPLRAGGGGSSFRVVMAGSLRPGRYGRIAPAGSFCPVSSDCLIGCGAIVGGACRAISSLPDRNQACRAISTGQLNALLRLHLQPIDVVVFHGSQGDLVSRGASRLDAFSGYPVRT